MKAFSPWLLSAALVCALAPTARADGVPADLASAFIELCGATYGDPAFALAIADREGWEVPPAQAMQPPAFGPGRWTHIDGRRLRLRGGMRVLVVGTQVDPGGRSAHSCSVGDWRRASPDEMSQWRDALARWVGGEPVQASAANDFAKFAFRDADGQRRPLASDDPALSADLPPPGVKQVTLISALGMPMIMYMSWR